MRIFAVLLALLPVVCIPGIDAAPRVSRSGTPSGPPIIGARAAILMDARTGRVLYDKDPHLRWPPASTTKIMTALLVAESLPDDALVPISARAAAERSGSAIGLEVGERWRVGDLLHALLIHSANDAAIALAEAVAGSVEEFAVQMNARARSLGARDSHFVTPHGLFNPLHYSTAYDLSVVARAALRSRRIAELARTRTWELVTPNQPPRMLINTNKILWRYPGADGVKTGWIAESGLDLVASATRNGWQLIAVVLNAPQMYADAARILDYGFETFTPVPVAVRNQVITSAAVANGTRLLEVTVPEDVVAVVRRGATVASRVDVTRQVAPIRQGEVVGSVAFTSEGAEVVRSPLVAREAVPVRSLWARVVQWLRHLFLEADGEQS